ncbi:hypothetical protein A2Z00_04630 [Candidatus Gottesmanbacteria bacterium RBG_13_45_10]|uniref:Uncharacterized protein n=1 Tax=Candidatus Gottesmanbacteria bacterium RBG_13_45_10 TaxID=1798370 RepID=A0A1F5ZG33_9BACT|nr:MAG: hypothetical protein A2Z00_04630 [Candidatus Gottesmanbacteria bacterium RBG_13_45_10]
MDQIGEQRVTQALKDMGHAKKIAKLEEALKPHKDTITAKPGYLPAWQEAARELAPAVAEFYLLHPET